MDILHAVKLEVVSLNAPSSARVFRLLAPTNIKCQIKPSKSVTSMRRQQGSGDNHWWLRAYSSTPFYHSR